MCGLVKCDVRCSMVWFDVIWCSVVMCGVVYVVWCGCNVRFGMVWYMMQGCVVFGVACTWCSMVWFDIWFGVGVRGVMWMVWYVVNGANSLCSN